MRNSRQRIATGVALVTVVVVVASAWFARGALLDWWYPERKLWGAWSIVRREPPNDAAPPEVLWSFRPTGEILVYYSREDMESGESPDDNYRFERDARSSRSAIQITDPNARPPRSYEGRFMLSDAQALRLEVPAAGVTLFMTQRAPR